MARRMYYSVNPGARPLERVLMIEGDGEQTSVYCPPGLANGPWIEEFNSGDSAVDLAALLAKQRAQAAVLITRDKVAWWLDGLTMVGDSDVRDRQEDGGSK